MMRRILPSGMLLGLLVQNISWLIALLIFALQFPFYGVAFGAASVKDRLRPLAIGDAAAHYLVMMVGFVVEYTQQNQ